MPNCWLLWSLKAWYHDIWLRRMFTWLYWTTYWNRYLNMGMIPSSDSQWPVLRRAVHQGHQGRQGPCSHSKGIIYVLDNVMTASIHYQRRCSKQQGTWWHGLKLFYKLLEDLGQGGAKRIALVGGHTGFTGVQQSSVRQDCEFNCIVLYQHHVCIWCLFKHDVPHQTVLVTFMWNSWNPRRCCCFPWNSRLNPLSQ